MIVGGGAAADRHPAVAWRARLARLPAQHVPERDDAAHHGDQLFRFHAAHICGARPDDGGRRRATAFSDALRVVGPACVLTHAAAGLSLLGLLVLGFRPDPRFRRGGVPVDPDRLGDGARAGARPGRADSRRRGRARSGVERPTRASRALRRFCDFVAQRMLRRPGLNAALGLLAVMAPGMGLSRAAAALSPRRPDAGPGARGGGKPASRPQAQWRQSDRRVHFLPAGGDLFAPGDPAGDRRGAPDHGGAAGNRQCLVARDAAPMARRKTASRRLRDPQAIRRSAAALLVRRFVAQEAARL